MHYNPLTTIFSLYSTCAQLKATAAGWMGASQTCLFYQHPKGHSNSLPAGRTSLLHKQMKNPIPSKNPRATELAEHCKCTRRRKKKLCLYDLKTFKINLKMRTPLQITLQSQACQKTPIIAQILQLAEKQCQLSPTSLGTPLSDRTAPQRNNLQDCIMAGSLLDHLMHLILCIEKSCSRNPRALAPGCWSLGHCTTTKNPLLSALAHWSPSFLGDQEGLPTAVPPRHLPFHSHSPCSL